jgi:triacylglycerol lipase
VLGCEVVGRVVCVASPHDGTRLGPLGLGAAARELSPGAAFVRALAAAPLTRPTLNIWTRHDNVIIPRESSQRATEDRELAGAWAHNGSIFAAETCEAIVGFLSEADPPPPRPRPAPASSSR